MKIKSTINPKGETAFIWSYMIGEHLQVLKYKRRPNQWFSFNWNKHFMHWLDVGRFGLRWHP